MIKKSTALIAVLVLFCVACNEGSRHASKADNVQINEVRLERLNAPPPPSQSPKSSQKRILKFSTPVIEEDKAAKN